MGGVVWKKVWRDLTHSKARTALAVLSTAVGVFALGLVFGMSGTMRAQMAEKDQLIELNLDPNLPHIQADPDAEVDFRSNRPGHWLADIYSLARQRLRAAGVEAVGGGEPIDEQTVARGLREALSIGSRNRSRAAKPPPSPAAAAALSSSMVTMFPSNGPTLRRRKRTTCAPQSTDRAMSSIRVRI